MSEKIIYGYKDFFSRFAIFFTGLIVLVGVNLLFLVRIYYQQWFRWSVLAVVFMGWVFRKMWRIFAKLHYKVDAHAITIVLPKGKEFVLARSQIEKIEKHDRISSRQGRGVKYLFWKNEFHFTTSTKHIQKIWMKDGRVVVISPKEWVE